MAKIVYKSGQGEIIEKKSRFIATVCRVESEAEAVEFINKVKKQYWDASHNCFAYVLGEQSNITRCSDDGEPAQTAGRPMLEVLLQNDIQNVVVVVTRYFGGTLLGTGGLVRAYQKAVTEGLKASCILDRHFGICLKIQTAYTEAGRLQYLFAQKMIPVLSTDYQSNVCFTVMVPVERREEIEKGITEQTSAKAQLEWQDTAEYVIFDKKTVILKKTGELSKND